MHYKNGREAKENDPVVYFDEYQKKAMVGVVHTLIAGTDTCNCQVAYPVIGGVTNACKTLKELYHAEDAWEAVEPKKED